MYHGTTMVICIKQRLNSTWSLIHDKVKQGQGWVKKHVVYKKSCILLSWTKNVSFAKSLTQELI